MTDERDLPDQENGRGKHHETIEELTMKTRRADSYELRAICQTLL